MKKVKVGKSKIHGNGLFADEPIKRGDVIELVHTMRELEPGVIKTTPTLLGRNYNHSDDSNALNVVDGNNRYLVALKEIEAGGEITTDYRTNPELEQPGSFTTNDNYISFDYDDTLTTPEGFKLAQQMNKEGKNLYVITARDKVTPQMIERAEAAGIPKENIIPAGSDEAKVRIIKENNINKHIDNKDSVIKALGDKGELFVPDAYPDLKADFVEMDLSDDDLNKLKEGGFVIEEYANGGEPDPKTNFYTVQGSDGVYRKVNGKWEVDWNRSGNFQPLSKGDLAKRTAVLNSQAKPLYDSVYDDLYSTKQSSYSAKPKPSPNKKLTQEDKAAQEKFEKSFDVKTGPKEMTIDDYQYPAGTNAAASWESQKEQLPQAYKDVNDFYSNWYMGRATIPEFRDVALQRYNALNPQVTVQATPEFQKDHPESLFAATYRKTTSDKNKDKANQIFIANAMRPDMGANDYYNWMEGDPKHALQYFTNEYAHEKSHWYENNFPQEGTAPDYYDDELPSKSQLYAKGKPTRDYLEVDNSPEASVWTNDRFKGVPAEQLPYLGKPTELRARLNVWRMQNNIDPTKKYTTDEIRKIMDDNIKNFGTEHNNVRELYKLINNNPEALKEINDRYVSNDSDKELNMAADGGEPDPKTNFYTVEGSGGVYRKVNGKWEVDWNRSGKFQPLSKGDVAKRTAVLNSQAKPLYDQAYDDLYTTQRQPFTSKPVNKPTPAKSTGKIESFDNSLYTADETTDYKPINYVDKNDPSKLYIIYGDNVIQPGRPGGSYIKDKDERKKIKNNARLATQFDLDRLPANQIYSSPEELEYIRRAASGEDPYAVSAELKNKETANKDKIFFDNNFQLKDEDPNKWDPQQKDLMQDVSDKGEQFMRDWQNSPMYREMLSNSLPGDQAQYMPFYASGRDNQLSILNPIFMNEAYKPGEWSKSTGLTAAATSVGEGRVRIYPKTYSDIPQFTLPTHEYSHVADNNGRLIPQKDIDLMRSFIGDPLERKRQFSNYAYDTSDKGKQKIKAQYDYISDPTETRARLNELRFLGKDSGLYDPFTQKVTPEIFKQFNNLESFPGGNQPLEELKDVYTDEQILEMLNNISKNNESNQEFNFAQNGGQQGDRFKKRLMKRYPGMQGVYGAEGENLNIVKDPNYDARSAGYGDIEFIHPGQSTINYPNRIEKGGPEYTFTNPSPDKYTSVYNPKGANRGDIFLDMMHGMRDDPNYQPLLQNFEKAVRDTRGGDMAWYYEDDVKNDGYTDGQEQWDENYIDSQLRAELAPGSIGMFSHGRRDYRLDRKYDSPEMRDAAEDIRNYLKGAYEDGGELDTYPKGGGPGKGKKGKGKKSTKFKPKGNVKPFVTSDPKEYAYRKAAYDDSLNLYNLNKGFRDATNKYFFTEYDHLTKPTTKNTKAAIEEWKKVHAIADKWTGYKRKSKVPNKPVSGSFKSYGSGHTKWINTNAPDVKVLKKKGDVVLVESPVLGYKKPVQPVQFKKQQPPIVEKKVIEPTLVPQPIPTLVPQPIPTPLIINPELQKFVEEREPGTGADVMPVYDTDELPMYATPDGGAEWIGDTERYVDWDGNRIPYRLPRFRKPGHGGDLIRRGKQRYIPFPSIESRYQAEIVPEEEYADGGERKKRKKDSKGRYRSEDGNVRTPLTPEMQAVMSPDEWGQYIQEFPEVYITRTKEQQEAMNAARNMQLLNELNYQRAPHLYLPDGSLRPQAAEAADWLWQLGMTGPAALKGANAAMKIPLGAGVNVGSVLNAGMLAHGATQVDDRYQDWQDVAEGNMDWKEATLKTGMTALELSPAYGATKNAYGAAKKLLPQTYKINPFAGKLGTYNRVVGPNAIDDWRKSGLVRVTEEAGVPEDLGFFGINNRTTPYPSFGPAEALPQKKYANRIINQGKKPYIISTSRPMKASNMGQHGAGYTMWPVGEAGKYMKGFPASEAKVFEYADKPHWFWGYKQVPKELPGSPNTFKSSLGSMDMSKYEIKNPDYFTQLLNTYDSRRLSNSNKQFYKDLIANVKKQNGIATERQYNELQRLRTGNFNFGKKGYSNGGPINLFENQRPNSKLNKFIR